MLGGRSCNQCALPVFLHSLASVRATGRVLFNQIFGHGKRSSPHPSRAMKLARDLRRVHRGQGVPTNDHGGLVFGASRKVEPILEPMSIENMEPMRFLVKNPNEINWSG